MKADEELGSLPVGDAQDDISPLGVRDLSGNGSEWTSNVSGSEFQTATLRGRSYLQPTPLLYDILRPLGQRVDPAVREDIESIDPRFTLSTLGFRIVIQP
jgi:hypothetical protein